MPWIEYVPMHRALPMVEAVNNATTEREHREAKIRLEGYKQRCEEMGQRWPGVELDLHFTEIADRPMCCGEYLDWHESSNTPNQ
jgi:hypothetical protein